MTMRRIGLLIPLDVDPRQKDDAMRDRCPRKDFFELARATGAKIVDRVTVDADLPSRARLARRYLGPGIPHSLWAYAHRREYDLFFSDSERIGLPLAALLKRDSRSTRHVMIGHWLTPWKKRTPLRILRLHTHIDRIICHIEIQRSVAEQSGVPHAKVAVVPYGIDHRFWRPLQVDQDDLICAVGMERRDYPTLFDGMRGSPIPIVVAAASPWFDKPGVKTKCPPPATLTVGQFDYLQLRELYARSRFVVVPLLDLDFQAGITTILEAMAMGKPVVVTRTRGLQDAGVVRHGENGLFVAPGDAMDLRRAVDHLWSHPNVARAMGHAGCRLVADQFNVDEFAGETSRIINALM